MNQIFPWLFENKKRFFLILLGLAFFLRISSLYYTFLDVDESQFAGFAHVLMGGGLPYEDSLDTKPPLIYLFYTLCFFIFGKYSMWGVHLVSIFLAFGTAYFLYKTAKENGEEKGGLFAALFYTVFSTAYFPKFISTSIASVMVLPLVLSVFFWMRGERKLLLGYDFLAGLCVGLAFLFKYQAGIQIVVFFCFLLPFFKFRKEDFSVSAIRYLVFFGGFLLPIALTVGILIALGVGSDFYQWSLLGSFKYIGAGHETIPFFQNLLIRGGGFIVSTFLIWYLAARTVNSNLKPPPLNILLILWFALSLIPVCIGGRFYGHYFIQLLPPLCLLAGIATAQLQTKKALNLVVLGALIPAVFFWFLRVDQRMIYKFFPDDQLFEQQEIGEYIRENTKPEDTLFVWGFATAIYFHAQRAPVSRFLWTDFLTGKVPGSEKAIDPSFKTEQFAVPEAWEALWEDFKKNPPTYFVDTSTANIHDYKKYPLIKYPKLFDYIQNNYRFWKNVEGCLIYKRR